MTRVVNVYGENGREYVTITSEGFGPKFLPSNLSTSFPFESDEWCTPRARSSPEANRSSTSHPQEPSRRSPLRDGARTRARHRRVDRPRAGADAPRVQAVEVEVQAAAYMEKQGTEPTTTKTGSDAGGPRADVDEGDAEWRCETCMVS